MNYRPCGCERGGDCTKTTMCAFQSDIEDLEEDKRILREAILTAVAILRNDRFRTRVKSALFELEDALEAVAEI